MARTITDSEHVNGAGEAVYVATIYCASRAEREAVKLAALALPTPPAFQPGPRPGEPFDAFEGIPPSYTPEVTPADAACAGDILAHAQHEAAVDGEECTAGACLLTRGSD